MTTAALSRRFVAIEEVPILACAVIAHNHPDYDIIVRAYQQAGSGIGVDHAASYQPITERTAKYFIIRHKLSGHKGHSI